MSESRMNKASGDNALRGLSTDDLNKLISEIPLEDDLDLEYLNLLLDELDTRHDVPSIDVDAAWENFKNVKNGGDFHYSVEISEIKTQTKSDRTVRHRSPRRLVRRFLVAAVAIIITFSFAVAAGAFPTIRQAIARWTSDVFSFRQHSPDGVLGTEQAADGAGYASLQDALLSMGITEALAPKWIPKGFVSNGINVFEDDFGTQFTASYLSGDEGFLIINILHVRDHYNGDYSFNFEKDNNAVATHVSNGITHYIVTDVNISKAVWSLNDYECLVSISDDYEIRDLIKIIDSIYER